MTTPENHSVLQAFAILRAFDERSPEITASEIADKLFPTNGGGTEPYMAGDEELR